jgi:hypothetical protein
VGLSDLGGCAVERVLGEDSKDSMDLVMKSVDILLLLNFLLFYALMILLAKLQKKHPEKKDFHRKEISPDSCIIFYFCRNNNIDSFADLRFSYRDHRCDFACLFMNFDLLVG